MTKREYRRTNPHNNVMEGQMCIGPDCDRPAMARFLCIGHYTQQRRGIRLRPIRTYKWKEES